MKHQKNTIFYKYEYEKIIFTKRIFISFIVTLLFFFILVINLYKLQVLQFELYNDLSNRNRIKIFPIHSYRGIIFDRHKNPIAINKNLYQIDIIPRKIKNFNQNLNDLNFIINFNENDLKILKKKSFIYFQYNLNELQLAKFFVNQYRFPFLKIKFNQQRYYPYNSLFTHVVGYSSKIDAISNKKSIKENNLIKYMKKYNIGKTGIELFYENILHGKTGYRAVEINNQGSITRQLYIKNADDGNNIFLTLDLNLQKYITNLLPENIRAAIVVTDPRNGEVLSMISRPSYNPNLFVEKISSKNFKNLINNTYPLINRTIQGNYPPASTVKPYIIISALKEGVINKDTYLIDPGWWKLPGYNKRYRDWKRSGHGKTNILKSLEESSDTFFYKIAYDMGIDKLSYWMKKFGYGTLTGIDLFEENSGNMPTREWKIKKFHKPWYQGDTIPIGIGQGYWTATPLQMNKAMMTLINNGISKIPHILLFYNKKNKFFYFSNKNMYLQNKNTLKKINHDYWKIVKNGMYGVANNQNGTSYKNFQDAPYKIAAKSGTAQIYDLKENEIYNSKNINKYLRDHKLMTAFAPYNHPKIAISMILENGGESNFTVGETVRKIMDFYILNKK